MAGTSQKIFKSPEAVIAALRKRHWLMWLIIAAILPLLTIIAFLKAPDFPSDDFRLQRTTFPELVSSVVSENYVFNVKKSYSGGLILEVMQISDINPASELVSVTYSSLISKKKSNVVLGMMGGDKTYLFNMKDILLPFSVQVTDTIKHNELASISF